MGVNTLKETEKTYGPWEPGKPSAEEVYKRACEAASSERSRRAARVSHSSTCDTNHMKEARRSLLSKLPKQADAGQVGATPWSQAHVADTLVDGERLNCNKQTENHSGALNSKSNFCYPKLG